jgi:hypothetical protein
VGTLPDTLNIARIAQIVKNVSTQKDEEMMDATMKFKISIQYLIAFIVLFLIETLIALYVNDRIVRPYIGDVLVVILVYSFVKMIVSGKIRFIALYVFLFAVLVEIAQFFNITSLLHLSSNEAASTIIGTSFDWLDIVCYGAGCIVIEMWERIFADRFE